MQATRWQRAWESQVPLCGPASPTPAAPSLLQGTKAEPTYKQVCRGRTGHAEAVRVVYDPARCSYRDLLACFWDCVDPFDPFSGQVWVGAAARACSRCHGSLVASIISPKLQA